MRGFNVGKFNGPHPKSVACPSVEAVQVSLPAGVFRTSDEDAPARNNGAAVTRTRECRFPSDVIRRPPMERRFEFWSDTIAEWAAELRPIPSAHWHGEQQCERRSSLKKYSAIHVEGEASDVTICHAIARLSEFIYRFRRARSRNCALRLYSSSFVTNQNLIALVKSPK